MINKESTPLILASTSSARKLLLQRAGLNFEAISPDFDEEEAKKHLKNISPDELARELSRGKAYSLKERYPDACIIGSDQVCSYDGEIFSKPVDKEDLDYQLRFLKEKKHRIDTGLSVITPDIRFEVVVPVYVTLHSLLENEIAVLGERWRIGDPLYRIEDEGINLIRAIEGDFFALMGLPLIPLLNFLRGISLS